MAGTGAAGSSRDAPAEPQPDFRTAAMVFQGLSHLSDDDIRVFLRAAGVESSRRMLGLCHSVLMGLDGHYRARIQARDAILQQHHPGASMTTPSPSPAPGLGPTSKQATKGAGKTAQPKDAAAPKPPQPGTPSSSTTPPPTTARSTAPSPSTTGGTAGAATGKAAGAAVPRKTPPAKPATPASVPGTVKPGVVAHIGKRPPVVPPDPALGACFATSFEDTTAQDVELMVETPAAVATTKASPSTSQQPDTSLAYLDMIVPDLEDHMSMSPAPQVFPPVPTTPLSSEAEEQQGNLIDLNSVPEDDAPVTVTPWPRDDEDDDARPLAPAPQPAAMEAQTEPGASTTAATGSGDLGATGSGSQPAASPAAAAQTASAGDPQDAGAPLPPPKFPPPDVVDREQRRAERRAKERADQEAAAVAQWAGYPDPCNVLQNETNSIWTLPPGVPPQPAPALHADAHVQGYCNLGCETPKRFRTSVCLGRCYRPIIQTRAGTVHKHHFCSPCDRARNARDR